ncbi:MAG: hypothetical protein AAF518_00900 [Spirochaetota bacterium]
MKIKVFFFLSFCFGLSFALSSEMNKAPLPIPKIPGKELPKAQEQQMYRFSALTIYHYPKEIPRVFASGFVPPNSLATHATEYTGRYFTPSEVSVIYLTTLNNEYLNLYYKTFLEVQDLRILQKEEKEKETTLLLETRTKKLITIKMQEKKQYTRVKLFYRNILY